MLLPKMYAIYLASEWRKLDAHAIGFSGLIIENIGPKACFARTTKALFIGTEELLN